MFGVELPGCVNCSVRRQTYCDHKLVSYETFIADFSCATKVLLCKHSKFLTNQLSDICCTICWKFPVRPETTCNKVLQQNCTTKVCSKYLVWRQPKTKTWTFVIFYNNFHFSTVSLFTLFNICNCFHFNCFLLTHCCWCPAVVWRCYVQAVELFLFHCGSQRLLGYSSL